MQELVDRKRIRVEHPPAGRVPPDRREADRVCWSVDEPVVEPVQKKVEGDDVEERDEVVLGDLGLVEWCAITRRQVDCSRRIERGRLPVSRVREREHDCRRKQQPATHRFQHTG
jgi:hypothetical protein